MRKERWALQIMLLAAAAVLLFSGCGSKRKNVEELELSSLFSEEEGYHFGNIRWGMNQKEIQEVTDKALTSAAGYGANDISILNAEGLGIRLMGRVCDGATAAFDKNDVCYMISFVFRDGKYASSDIKLKEIASAYYEKIVETFGEPDETLYDSGMTTSVLTHYKECYWNYTTPDGKPTQLQWAMAYAIDEHEPSLLTLGLICMTEAVSAEDAVSEE